MFQSTHPRGVRHLTGVIDLLARQFQSTHPRGVRQDIWQAAFDNKLFQSTHPRGVRRGRTSAWCPCREGFNPRTRVGCDAQGDGQRPDLLRVSIHAPAWGATRDLALVLAGQGKVSIHAPAWGATGFQGKRGRIEAVSIHAPAWGATHSDRGTDHAQRCFNPRTRVGCDLPAGI